MKIELYNDGKNKYQSWEAKAVINSDISSGFSMLTLQAYGATEQEAKANLKTVVVDLMENLTKIKIGLMA